MLKVVSMPQASCVEKRFLDFRICIEDLHARKPFHVVGEASARADRSVDVEVVALSGKEVVGAVPRSCVYGTGSLLERDVVGEHGH